MGGHVGNGKYLDTVYRYDPESDSWQLMRERLRQVKSAPIAFAVKRSAFPKCY